MAKWADYLISAVQYNDDHDRIIKVRRHQDTGEKVGATEERSRANVVNDINKGITYCTIFKDANNSWKQGADVHVIEVNSVEYLRTDKNKTPKDNLENLPEF